MKSPSIPTAPAVAADRLVRPRVGARPAGLRWSALWLLLLPLPGLSTLFVYGLPMTHDGVTHLMRIARLDEAIRQGYLFPRWLPDLLLGYGYPALNYYAAGSYYLVELLYLTLAPSLYAAFVLAQALLVILAGIGAYRLAYDLLAERSPQPAIPALVAAAAYVYAPYLLINIYVRGAIAELGAQMLLPWILWSFRRIWRSPDPQAYVWGGALSLGLLAWTHTISLLTVPPLLVAYLLMLGAGRADWRPRARYSAFAILWAMLVSSFYWIPLILEKDYVSEIGFTISRTLMLPVSFYKWNTLVSTSLRYPYPEDPPFPLGLVQVAGAVVGVLLALRQPREWKFWMGVLAVCGVMMTGLAQPLWLNNDILPIIQFPWRLLALMQIPVALLFGLIVASIRAPVVRAGASAAVICLLVWAYLPHLPWATFLSPTGSTLNMPMNAYLEAEYKQIVEEAVTASSVQEFRPRWADETLELDPTTVPGQPGGEAKIALLAANPFRFQLRVESEQGTALRFANYYFPGWRARLDGTTPLNAYPTTNLGLLTFDVPPGAHSVEVEWTGTRAERWAALLSQVALALLILWQVRRPSRQRWVGAALVPLLGFGLAATYLRPAADAVQPVPGEPPLAGVRLLGHRGPELAADGIAVYPYWLATATQPPPFKLRWQVRAATGQVVAQTTAMPFYDSYSARHWAANTLVDDAYLIPLPAGLPPSDYQVVMSVLDEKGDLRQGEPLFSIPLGWVTLDEPAAGVAEDAAQFSLEVYFGKDILLRGYDFEVVAGMVEEAIEEAVDDVLDDTAGSTVERLVRPLAYLDQRPDAAVVSGGDTVAYTLYWQTARQTNEPYIGFIHLVDRLGRPIAQRDHAPGPILSPVGIWTTYDTYPDRYLLEVPSDAASGLYWPHVGMYNWKDIRRFDVRVRGVDGVNDHYQLPPLKVVNPHIQPEGRRSGVRFGEMAELTHYATASKTGEPLSESMQPGAMLALTLYYAVEQPSAQPLVRFAQVRDANNRIVAQHDGEPQDGLNPTWAWLPGETVQDTVALELPQDLPQGRYTLYVGFYDPAANAQRLPVTDAQGRPLPNAEAPLDLEETR